MSIRLKRPSNDVLRALIDAGKSDSLTYEPIGLSSLATPPSGYRRGRWSCQLGVVDVVDTPDCYSFAYGTLSVHPEQGEESFAVTRGPDDEIMFEIVAVSRARMLASRACPPVARRLQRAATMRYLDAMHTAVRTSG